MKYQGIEGFRHDTLPRVGVLVANLGTPDAPEKKALRRYLKEFLSDPRVVEAPRLLWQPILRGIILNTRPAKSARAYEQIWTDQGSPLMLHSRAIAEGIGTRLAHETGRPITVALAMRYGKPAISDVLAEMTAQGVRRLLVLPLYPQYSGSTTGSVFDAVSAHFSRQRWVPDLHFVGSYYDNPEYLDALAASIERFWSQRGRGEHLVMSFHGIPRKYFLSGDPYHCHCRLTARETAARLGLGEEEWTVSFQSRFGPSEWLTPYTDETVIALAEKGQRRIDVVCPGFAADCLETLEEIADQNAEMFQSAGGDQLRYIPALNADPAHLDMLSKLVMKRLGAWLDEPEDDERLARRAEAALERALALGAER